MLEAKLKEIFDPEVCALGEKLLHHQLWLWGHDIWHPDGNLLIRYGFQRFGVPSEKKGSNLYRYVCNNVEINLWGWGVFYGHETLSNSILIKRYSFFPNILTCWQLKTPVFNSEDLALEFELYRNDFCPQTAVRLTVLLIEWILSYETWIEKTCEVSWRIKCLQEWQNASLEREEIIKGFETLLHKLSK